MKLGSNIELQLMLPMSVCGVTKCVLATLFPDHTHLLFVAVDIVILPHINCKGHVSEMTYNINRYIV